MSKKILILEPFSTHFSGAQKVTYNVANILRNDKKDVEVLIRKSAEKIIPYYSQFKVRFFPLENFLKRTFGSGNFDGKSKLSKLFLFINSFFGIFFLNLYISFICKKNKIDTVYCYDPRGLILCCFFCKILNVSVIWHLHGELHFRKSIQYALSKLIKKTIVPSHYIANRISDKLSPIVVYNGFHFPNVNQEDNDFTNSASKKILYVGALTPQKGLHFLIYALHNSKLKDGNIILSVVGDSINSPEYKNWIKELSNSLPSNIKVNFMGWKDDVISLYQENDITCFTSIVDGVISINGKEIKFKSSEALPTVPIESIAMGTKVIALDNSGIDEILDENSGVILPQDTTPEDFYGFLIDVLNDREIGPEVVNEHRKKFSFENMQNCMLSILDK